MPMTLHPTSLADRTWVEQLDALLGPPEAGRDQYRRYPDQYKRKDFYRAKRGTKAKPRSGGTARARHEARQRL